MKGNEIMILGYVRVSSNDQNTERQYKAFQEYEEENSIKVERIFEDKASGRNFNREGYQALKMALREGDILVIKELDRLGRNMEQIKKEWRAIQDIGVDIVVLDTPILNTTNKTDLEKSLISNIVFELLAYLAEKERIKIKSRQAEGIKLAKEQGKYKGRKPIDFDRDKMIEVCKKWREGQMTARAAMKLMGFTSYKFYKEVNAMGL